VVLNGTVEGDVHASQRITLSSKARVNGNVHYKLIEMAGGAMINGQMVYEGESADKVAAIPHKQSQETDTSDGGRAAAIGGIRDKG
jgi:cytoskeletal protein CcmA (bactofilin family)